MNYKFSRAIAISLLFLGASVAHAQWTEPPLAPPSGNVSAPLRNPITDLNIGGIFSKTSSYRIGDSVWGANNFEVHTSSWNGSTNGNYGGIIGGRIYSYGGLNSGGSTGSEAGAGQLYVQGTSMLMGNVGAGTASPAYRLDVVGDANVTGCFRVNGTCLSSGGISGSGTTNYLPKWTGATALGNSQIFDNGSNVGIGTASPTEKLQVNGRVLVTGSSYTLNPAGPMFGQYTPTIGYIQAASGGDIEIWNGGTTAIASFKNSGNVGIGTGGPIYKLHAMGDVYADGGWLRTSGSNGWYNNTHDGGFYMSDSTWIRTQSDDSIWAGNGNIGTNGCLTVGYGGAGCGGASAILAGRVGIGTQTPVNGKVEIISTSGEGLGYALRATNQNSSNGNGIYSEGFSMGVNALATASNGIGVYADGQVNGVYGRALSSGSSAAGISGLGQTGSSKGVYGQANGTGYGVHGYASNSAARGVFGESFSGIGVYGLSTNSYGGYFTSSVSGSVMYCWAQNAGGWCGGNRNWTNSSDIRLKKNVETITSGLDKVLKLRGVTFNWKTDENNEYKNIGFIAQEVIDVLPEVIKKDDKGYYSISESAVTAVLVEAVKELKSENDALKARIESLEAKIK